MQNKFTLKYLDKDSITTDNKDEEKLSSILIYIDCYERKHFFNSL